MGNFKIEIEAIGDHCCPRDISDGLEVYGCGHKNCPLCQARKFVELLKHITGNVITAKFIHLPGEDVKP